MNIARGKGYHSTLLRDELVVASGGFLVRARRDKNILVVATAALVYYLYKVFDNGR